MDGPHSPLTVTSSTLLFPEQTHGGPTTVPLSIIDATVAHFARCAAVWFYESPLNESDNPTTTQYRDSLCKTLTSYPHWTGRLHWPLSLSKGNKDHTNRYHRVHVTYNTSDDPGVLFVTATSSRELSDFLPSLTVRKTKIKAWDASEIPTGELLPSKPLALSHGSDRNSPPLIIQVTTFSCGGTAVAISLTHALADAQALCQFAKDWSLTCRSLLQNPSHVLLPQLKPVFNPRLLDNCAAGNIDAANPNPELQKRARSLPLHRYDWFKKVPNQPWPSPTPEDFDINAAALSPSDPIPWDQWDVSAPVSHRVLHFSKEELNAIFENASTPESRISKHDALLAHIWARILHARQLPPGSEVFLNLTFGLRSRLDPPLPDSYLGSPIMLAAIRHTTDSLNASTATDSCRRVRYLASDIRSTLKLFDPQSLSAHLHDAAYEACPQRLWQACLGSKHLLVTTWVYAGAYDVFFTSGSRRRLRYVEPLMPSMDGLVEIMEAGLAEQEEGKKDWTSCGVDVSVYLESRAMRNLLDDDLLWGK